jgi:hypothetical protein
VYRVYKLRWYANTPQAPDLCIIDYVWGFIKQRAKRHKLEAVEQLKEAILLEWDCLDSIKDINLLVKTMLLDLC